ncbi:MAG: hypothetical protein WBW08_10985 [Methyloceanibacter sp.]|jgi:hypothetical protein
MGQKMMKTEKELQTIVLGELHTHAECSNVKQVTITRIYGETWGVKTTNHDHESTAHQRMMEEVVAHLNTAYGLAWERRSRMDR